MKQTHCDPDVCYREDVRVVSYPEQFARFPQADAVERGKVITPRQDAHVAKLFLSEDVSQ